MSELLTEKWLQDLRDDVKKLEYIFIDEPSDVPQSNTLKRRMLDSFRREALLRGWAGLHGVQRLAMAVDGGVQ